MTNRENHTSPRKLDHLMMCSGDDVERGSPGFDDVLLLHNALPECSMDEIDLQVTFLGHTLQAPFLISAMTGGHPETKEVNRRLAAAAEKLGVGMGVGSQRAALEDPSLADTFSVVRDAAPQAFLIANLGIVQLRDHGIAWAEHAVSMIDADAIAIHLNFLQEAIQPEGECDARGCLAVLHELCEATSTPVIVKETGNGLSSTVAAACFDAGAAAVDIGGFGGTSWAAVEGRRASMWGSSGDMERSALGRVFDSWGIPTVVSLIEVARLGGPVIATGGIRSGLDIAKAIALGAGVCGAARPLVQPALEGEEEVCRTMNGYLRQLRVAMFLTGAQNISDLRSVPATITGKTGDMVGRFAEVDNGY